MIGPLDGPWLVLAAVLLLIAAVRRSPRPPGDEAWVVVALVICAAGARLVGGMWGPLHINGQGPLWVRGALDPEALQSYGPGYSELFGWAARLGFAPDSAIFAANALLSALQPGLLYAAARLAGVERGGALVAALLLAADPVTIRTAASEGYFSSMTALVLGVGVSLALWVQANARRDRFAFLALAAACLLAAAAARIHPMAYLLLALSPLVVFGSAAVGGRARFVLTAAAAAAIAATVVLSSGNTIFTALGASPMTAQAIGALGLIDYGPLLALGVAVLVLHRWIQPPWLPLLAVFSLALMLATQGSFQQHPLWKLCYQRLFWPGLLLGGAALLPRRMQSPGWELAVTAALAAVLFIPTLPLVGQPNTEQLEYRFLQEVLHNTPRDCTLASVTRIGNRVWESPSYLVPTSAGGAGMQRNVQAPSDLEVVAQGGCLLYVRSSLCASAEARELCESIEHQIPLERVASQVLPAVPSYTGLPYDRSAIEVVVFRVADQATAEGTLPGAGREGERAAVSDGAAITPKFAQALYETLTQMPNAEGCRLVKFDTARFRITIGLQAPSGTQHDFEIATARIGQGGRRAGGWALAVPDELERDCPTTLSGLERALAGTAAPQQQGDWNWTVLPTKYTLLAASFVLLVLGTARILYREARARRPSPHAVLALVIVWGAALALRLSVSPRTFLHEYYHIAETVVAYQIGELSPVYGNTGPAIFRLVGTALGQPENVQVIFLTNAVLSSLAIPAVALLDLALMGSWPRALLAGVLLCVLPQHLRFSAAEDLFVQAITFGMWTLGLFALYTRTRRLDDALLAAVGLSLAMQARPEMLFFPAVLMAMVLLVEPRSWRVLFAWRTLLALAVLGLLLIPRFIELRQVVSGAPTPTSMAFDPQFFLRQLIVLQARVTPPILWGLLLVGLVWGAWRTPGLVVWVASIFLGYTAFSLSLFSNSIYNLRSQMLPTSYLVLIAAGAAAAWMELWGRRRRVAVWAGSVALIALGAAVVVTYRGVVTERRDQQLEWEFLERTVPRLPERATLLSAIDVGGRKLDAFPTFLLERTGKAYETVDVRRAANGDVEWPTPSDHLLYYQGMFCHFQFSEEEPPPNPLTATCNAVHDRYVTEPLFVEDLDTQPYSQVPPNAGPYRIGFFRLKAPR